MQQSVITVIKESGPKITHYLDYVGNPIELITSETIVIQQKGVRTWLKKNRDGYKGERRKGNETPEPFHGKPAQKLWEKYTGV